MLLTAMHNAGEAIDHVGVRVQPQSGDEVPISGVEREPIAIVVMRVGRRRHVERGGVLVERVFVEAVDAHNRCSSVTGAAASSWRSTLPVVLRGISAAVRNWT